MKKQYRTSWTVDNLADWLSRYDEIHKAGTMREPYDYKTWQIIVQNYDEVTDDTIREICDGLVPVYNSELIDHCAHYNGKEFWDIWYGNEFGGETPLDIIRGNLFALYLQIGQEVLTEREEE